MIIKGPGCGEFAPLCRAVNSIGRSQEQAVTLDFGDGAIASKDHCFLTFEPEASKYYLQDGDGKEPTLVNDSPLAAKIELNSGDRIRLGETVLLFRPLCDEKFSWNN